MVKLRPLSDFIEEVDERNRNLNSFPLVGVSINKIFMPSVANIVGTDLRNYKIIRNGLFACSLMQVSRDGGVAISLYKQQEPSIVSPAYYLFKVKSQEVLTEYLEIVFNNPEFDREAVFYAVGGVRGTLTWEEFLAIEIPVPNIQEQIFIIQRNKTINKKINNLVDMSSELLNLGISIFRNTFDFDETNRVTLSSLCAISSGKRIPKEMGFSYKVTSHPYIRVRDVNDRGYVYLTNSFKYIDEDVYLRIPQYTVKTDDLLISTIGTVGLVGRVHESLNKANLTENCFRIRANNDELIDYLFYYLIYLSDEKKIDEIIDGSVQAKLPLQKFRDLEIILPDMSLIRTFNKMIKPIRKLISNATNQIINLNNMLMLLEN